MPSRLNSRQMYSLDTEMRLLHLIDLTIMAIFHSSTIHTEMRVGQRFLFWTFRKEPINSMTLDL